MSGHSKWATIKHKKGALDAKRGKLFTKLIKEITVAARMGGGDPGGNPRLRKAIADAKGQSMPNDTITRATKRGTGEIEGAAYEEILYEGTGPSGTLFLVEAMTDNRNRTVAEIRKIFELTDGKLGATGCVAWMFDRKGMFLIPGNVMDEDALLEFALDHGADDVKRVDDKFEVTCDPANFAQVDAALRAKGIQPELAEISRIPTSTVDLDAESGRKVLKLMEKLDDHDDVQRVSANFNIPQEALAEIEG